MYRLVVKSLDSLLLNNGFALGVMLFEVNECPRAFACGKSTHIVVVLPQPVLRILGYPFVENIEALAPDDVGVHRSVYI